MYKKERREKTFSLQCDADAVKVLLTSYFSYTSISTGKKVTNHALYCWGHFLLLFVILVIEFKTSYMPGKYSAAETLPNPELSLPNLSIL